MRYIRLNISLTSVYAIALTAPVLAEAQTQNRDNIFNLGEIVIIGSLIESIPISGAVIGEGDIWTYEKPTLEQAVNLAPGVNSTFDSNGRRNEFDIFVRGFGRWQVPLSIDGVRVYLPADNRLDFSRFLTNDIAEIQIQKGYASVLDGPGAMGAPSTSSAASRSMNSRRKRRSAP